MELAARYEQFGTEHVSAVEQSRLHDQDMIDKARRIKDQDIEMKTLENLLHEKTKEMLDQLSDIDLKEKELAKAKERINNFEDVISAKEAEIESLKTVLSDHSKIIDLKTSYEQMKNDLSLMLEAKTVLEYEISEKNSSAANLQQQLNSNSTEAGNL